MARLNGDEVRRSMQDAGIPDAAISTTLVREGCQNIRDHICGRGFIRSDQPGYQGIFLYPERLPHAAKARKVFYVVAKEFLLSGIPSYCISLSRLVTALGETEDGELDYFRVTGANMVFVTEFYEQDAPFPLQPWQAGVLRSWIRNKFDSRGGVSFLSDRRLDLIQDWWPESFRHVLAEHVRQFPVSN